MLAIIRAFSYQKSVGEAISLMRESLNDLTSSSSSSSSSLATSQMKLFSVGIEVCLHNDRYQESLDLLHEMVEKTNGKEAVPRSCYMLLLSRFSSSSSMVSTKEEKKAILDDMYLLTMVIRMMM